MAQFQISIDPQLADILPSFIELSQKDMDHLQQAIDREDWGLAKQIAHSLKGDCGGYGFMQMSDIARGLEEAILGSDRDGITSKHALLLSYWQELLVAYGDQDKK